MKHTRYDVPLSLPLSHSHVLPFDYDATTESPPRWINIVLVDPLRARAFRPRLKFVDLTEPRFRRNARVLYGPPSLIVRRRHSPPPPPPPRRWPHSVVGTRYFRFQNVRFSLSAAAELSVVSPPVALQIVPRAICVSRLRAKYRMIIFLFFSECPTKWLLNTVFSVGHHARPFVFSRYAIVALHPSL